MNTKKLAQDCMEKVKNSNTAMREFHPEIHTLSDIEDVSYDVIV